MSKSESPTDKDSLKKTSRPTIEELSGTLFMLAVVSDEDDAVTLRADLKRSRLDEYKLQCCATAKDARNMLRACTFDLLILQLDEFESPESEVERFREANTRPNVERSERVGGDEMRRLIIQSTIHKATSQEAGPRLNLSMQAAAWTHYPKRGRSLELKGISSGRIGRTSLPQGSSPIASLKNDLVECLIRVNGDQELTSIIGVIRELPKANESYDRITEANQAIKEALEAREDAFRKADQKLKALAEEFASDSNRGRRGRTKKSDLGPSGVTSGKKNRPRMKNKPLSEPRRSSEYRQEGSLQGGVQVHHQKKAATPKQESLPFDFAQNQWRTIARPIPPRSDLSELPCD